MKIIETGRSLARTIDRFGSHGAASTAVGSGAGEAHVYAIHMDAGGEIGPHEAGFDQLFIVAEGSGWGAGADGIRARLGTGQAALFRRGEVHSKGSDDGMTAIMIQIGELTSPSR